MLDAGWMLSPGASVCGFCICVRVLLHLCAGSASVCGVCCICARVLLHLCAGSDLCARNPQVKKQQADDYERMMQRKRDNHVKMKLWRAGAFA
eukprot:1162768-Rhodomonas_salina.1